MSTNKRITIEEGSGIFSTCNCCSASTSEVASPIGKKVDKVYKIELGGPNSIVITACEDCLKQLIGEVALLFNGKTNNSSEDKLDKLTEWLKDTIAELESYAENDEDAAHDCGEAIESYNLVLSFIEDLNK